jgi:hypothetical protein
LPGGHLRAPLKPLAKDQMDGLIRGLIELGLMPADQRRLSA